VASRGVSQPRPPCRLHRLPIHPAPGAIGISLFRRTPIRGLPFQASPHRILVGLFSSSVSSSHDLDRRAELNGTRHLRRVKSTSARSKGPTQARFTAPLNEDCFFTRGNDISPFSDQIGLASTAPLPKFARINGRRSSGLEASLTRQSSLVWAGACQRYFCPIGRGGHGPFSVRAGNYQGAI